MQIYLTNRVSITQNPKEINVTLTNEQKLKRNEYMRQYRANNKEKMKEADKRKYLKKSNEIKQKRKDKWHSDVEQNRKKLREQRASNLPQAAYYSISQRKNQCHFDIDEEYIKSIWPKDNICPVFGVEMKRNQKGQSRDFSPSVDRIHPSKGYTKGNVVIVSFKANRMKNNGTVEDLKKVLHFYEHHMSLE